MRLFSNKEVIKFSYKYTLDSIFSMYFQLCQTEGRDRVWSYSGILYIVIVLIRVSSNLVYCTYA